MNIKTVEVLYCIAQDFVKLSFMQKFNVGIDLGLIHPEEYEMEEKELEERIFVGMYSGNQLEKFVNILYRIMHEN